MSENKQMEAVETTEVVEVTEKVGVITKAKDFCKKHKKGLIIGGAAALGAVVGLIKVFGKSGDDCDDEYVLDEDEYSESDAEEVETDDETIE